MMKDFYMGAYWSKRPMTLAQFIASVRVYLIALRELHPIFAEIYQVGKRERDAVLLLQDLANLEDLALNRAYDPKHKNYTEVDANGAPTLRSISATGYRLTFDNLKFDAARRLILAVGAGASSPQVRSAVTIDYPEDFPSEFGDAQFTLKLLEIVVKYWQPAKAIVSSRAFRDLTGDQPGREMVGWLTYFDDADMAAQLPEGVGCWKLGEGILISVSPEPASADNPIDVAVAKSISNVLQPRTKAAMASSCPSRS